MILLDIINEFTVESVDKSIEFYSKYFGFEVEETDGNPITWVRMRKDTCFIMFENYAVVCKEFDNYPVKVNTSNLVKFKYDNREELVNLYNKLVNDKAEIFMELKETEYGSYEFGVIDPDRNMIIVSC